VTATRDDSEPDRKDLWWAHTGGGGGNFGVVTRFWFKNLPTPPSRVLITARAWDWVGFSQEHFTHLVSSYGEYFATHQNPTTSPGRLFALLTLTHNNGTNQIGLVAQVDAENEDPSKDAGAAAMRDFLTKVDSDAIPTSSQMLQSVAEHAPIPNAWTPRLMPWLTATQALNSSGENRCGKYKSAYLRKPFTPAQITAMWDYLGNTYFTDFTNSQAVIQIDSYGSAINHPLHETAYRQRNSILKMQYQVYWNRRNDTDPGDQAKNLKWIRDTYRATFAGTGGVPIIGDRTDGCYINYPDIDLNDTKTWNTSGQAWSQLYYKEAYPRLQRVKARWDPLHIFHHTQSIEPAPKPTPDNSAHPAKQ
jgi:hypothetical protein